MNRLFTLIACGLILFALYQAVEIKRLGSRVRQVSQEADAVVEERRRIREGWEVRIEMPAVAVAAEVQEDEPDENPFIPLENVALPEELQQYAWELCQEYTPPFEVVMAIMWRESRFTEDAVGVNGNGTQDYGLMQINNVNRDWLAEEHGITDLMDPYQNIHGGIIILDLFWREYTPEEAVTAYGSGLAGMQRSGVTQSALFVLEKAQEFVIGEEERDAPAQAEYCP